MELTLTTDGAARFDALARDVGTGGQIAVVVDGRVVSARRLAGGPPPNKGVVTGLDEPTARGLADRLRP